LVLISLQGENGQKLYEEEKRKLEKEREIKEEDEENDIEKEEQEERKKKAVEEGKIDLKVETDIISNIAVSPIGLHSGLYYLLFVFQERKRRK
jgi:hypothetical protein